MNYKHIPVMLDEVLENLNPEPGEFFIDCTLGGGGYTFAISERIGEEGIVVALDADEMAIKNSQEKIKKDKNKNIILFHENFRNLQTIIDELSEQEKKFKTINFDGIVFDLGLSSAQLEDRSRGLSFQLDAPLNMAFGEDSERTKKIVNKYKEEDIEKILREFGEEKFSRRIANGIVEARKEKTIETTKQLLEIIEKSVPEFYKRGKLHFATRTFQALRIATNEELESLEKVLPQALKLLKKGGKIVIVSFHSLEDRIVKHFFKEMSRDCICPKEVPLCVCKNKAKLKILTKKPIMPSDEEIKNNPRSRSAKMRVAQKI